MVIPPRRPFHRPITDSRIFRKVELLAKPHRHVKLKRCGAKTGKRPGKRNAETLGGPEEPPSLRVVLVASTNYKVQPLRYSVFKY
jgi:hypothetical protein